MSMIKYSLTDCWLWTTTCGVRCITICEHLMKFFLTLIKIPRTLIKWNSTSCKKPFQFDYKILRCNNASDDLIFPLMRFSWYFCAWWRWIKGYFNEAFVTHKGWDIKEIYCSSFSAHGFVFLWVVMKLPF